MAEKIIEKCAAGEEFTKELSVPVFTESGSFGNIDFTVGYFPVDVEVKSIQVYNLTRAGGEPKIGFNTTDFWFAPGGFDMPASNTVLDCPLDSTSIRGGTALLAGIIDGTTSDPEGVLIRVQYVEKS